MQGAPDRKGNLSMEGLHILAELSVCKGASALMLEAAALETLCVAACAEAGLSVVGRLFHPFGAPNVSMGVTGAVILAESHLAIHTWPELDVVTLDLYVCNFSRDNRAAAERVYARLIQAFQPESAHRRNVWRSVVEVGKK
jgi:spermidine synthase/S-adenosylmethionine decarboxylase